MNTYAIVPVKELGSAKTRLARSLSAEGRKGLLKAMLSDVLDALEGLPTIVISPEDLSGGLRGREVILLRQAGGSGLDHAVKQANRYAVESGADSTLFVPADMPLLNPDDVREVLRLGEVHDAVITHANDGGTGILYRRPPDVMDSRFTPNSFEDHLAEAERRKVDLHILKSPNLSLDIDTAEDVRLFRMRGRGTRTFEYLNSHAV